MTHHVANDPKAHRAERHFNPLTRTAKGLSAVSHPQLPVHGGGVLDSTAFETAAVDLANAADVFAALADPARLRVLAVLADGPRCVCDIQAAVPMAANVLSYHLRVLREVGLLEGTRRGRWIDYRRSDGAAQLVAGALHAAAFDPALGRGAATAASA
jgi:ArsR family transcriptional regulator, arsenate/arsenite/antimonite-responsive transcriptional repressor